MNKRSPLTKHRLLEQISNGFCRPPSRDSSLTHGAADVIISTSDISVTDIVMDRDLYEKGMNKWLFAPWFLILGVSWS